MFFLNICSRPKPLLQILVFVCICFVRSPIEHVVYWNHPQVLDHCDGRLAKWWPS